MAHNQYLILAPVGPLGPTEGGAVSSRTGGQAGNQAAQNKLLAPQASVSAPECKGLTTLGILQYEHKAKELGAFPPSLIPI